MNLARMSDNQDLIKQIEIVSKEIQSLVDFEFQKVNYKPDSESALDQAGLKNGIYIINEYNAVGE